MEKNKKKVQEVGYVPNQNPPETVVNLLQEQARQLGLAKEALRKVQLLSSIEIAKIIAKEALNDMRGDK